MGISIDIQGADKLSMKFTEMANSTKLEQAINESVAIVEGAVKDLTPVDTGALRSDIHPQPAHTEGNDIVGKVYTNKEYAMYVEYGTGVRGAGSHPKLDAGSYGSRLGQKAAAMFYRGFKQNQATIKNKIRSAIQKN